MRNRVGQFRDRFDIDADNLMDDRDVCLKEWERMRVNPFQILDQMRFVERSGPPASPSRKRLAASLANEPLCAFMIGSQHFRYAFVLPQGQGDVESCIHGAVPIFKLGLGLSPASSSIVAA
jgi:hypothetical protein